MSSFALIEVRPVARPLPAALLVVLCSIFAWQGCARSSFHEDYRLPVEESRSASVTPADWQFWWGVSTSSYQTEDPGPPSENLGFETDWDLAYRSGQMKEPRGNATWSYTCTQRDFAALKQLGVTHYRFSVEWARVEPRPGEFNELAIEHYVQLARNLRAAGITPLVTLWHFTFPSWLASDDSRRNGWLHPDMPARWHAYVERMAKALTPDVKDICPQNEPNTYALGSLVGYFPPGQLLGYEDYLRIQDRQADAFNDAAGILRAARPDVRIISVQNIIHWERDVFDPLGLWCAKGREYNYYHLDKIAASCDWIGFNYYMAETATPLMRILQTLRIGENCSDCGWRIDADGMAIEIAGLAKRYGKPMLITENGISTCDDRKRSLYLLKHVNAVRRAMLAGHDVRGYMHWSLMDNYEWADGYGEKFGLCELDSKSLAVIPRKSASLFRMLATEKRCKPLLPPIPAGQREIAEVNSRRRASGS
ncbi:MAG: glycoside hydrolase family 1 protein [Planctomycetes bacterium]|nr:glycoside hydrolase family 1 protein [Planctomycetota bacterium]